MNKKVTKKKSTNSNASEETQIIISNIKKEFRREGVKVQGRIDRRFSKLQETFECRLDEVQMSALKQLKATEKKFNKFQKKVESFEETFFMIYHNIKQNQFIYANYPKEWDETFLKMKENLKNENKEFSPGIYTIGNKKEGAHSLKLEQQKKLSKS